MLNSVHYGVTDWFSIGGGFEFVSTFTGFREQWSPIFYLAPKFSFDLGEKFQLGVGAVHVNTGSQRIVPSNNSGSFGGLTYAVVTYGSKESNVSLGGGLSYSSRNFNQRPVVTVSGMHRVSKRVALVSENWFVPPTTGSIQGESGGVNLQDYSALYSYGVRFLGEKMAVDVAFLNNSSIISDWYIGIPYVSFVVKL
jgi:hypothetical protein